MKRGKWQETFHPFLGWKKQELGNTFSHILKRIIEQIEKKLTKSESIPHRCSFIILFVELFAKRKNKP
jgi:hypothetical protein